MVLVYMGLHTWAMGLHTKYMATRAPGSPHKTYGPQISHTLCMGRWGGLRAPIRNTWASDLSYTYILYGDFSHIFCMGISLIHFVWGFCQLLELKRDTFNSVDILRPSPRLIVNLPRSRGIERCHKKSRVYNAILALSPREGGEALFPCFTPIFIGVK